MGKKTVVGEKEFSIPPNQQDIVNELLECNSMDK